MVEFKVLDGKEDLSEAFRIRELVFMDEQNVSRELEYDGLDKESKHILLYYNSIPVGTARIRKTEDRVKLERIAILKEYRGKGLGIKLVQFLIDYCKKEDMGEIYMYAQYYLLNYYSKFGFKPRGEIFDEAGIKHIEMYL